MFRIAYSVQRVEYSVQRWGLLARIPMAQVWASMGIRNPIMSDFRFQISDVRYQMSIFYELWTIHSYTLQGSKFPRVKSINYYCKATYPRTNRIFNREHYKFALYHKTGLKSSEILKNVRETVLETRDKRQKAEDRRQKTENRKQKTEDRRQKTENRRHKAPGRIPSECFRG